MTLDSFLHNIIHSSMALKTHRQARTIQTSDKRTSDTVAADITGKWNSFDDLVFYLESFLWLYDLKFLHCLTIAVVRFVLWSGSPIKRITAFAMHAITSVNLTVKVKN
jgi:hypothetical protein